VPGVGQSRGGWLRVGLAERCFIKNYEPDNLKSTALNKIVVGCVCVKIPVEHFEKSDFSFCKTL
jgi:hypothetical protein